MWQEFIFSLECQFQEQPGIKNWNGAYLYHFSADGTFVKSLFRGANSIDTTEYMNFVTGKCKSGKTVFADLNHIPVFLNDFLYNICSSLLCPNIFIQRYVSAATVPKILYFKTRFDNSIWSFATWWKHSDRNIVILNLGGCIKYGKISYHVVLNRKKSSFISGVPTSDIIAMATQGDLDNNVMSKLYPVVDVLDTTNQVRKHWINDAYVFAARKGMTFFFFFFRFKENILSQCIWLCSVS